MVVVSVRRVLVIAVLGVGLALAGGTGTAAAQTPDGARGLSVPPTFCAEPVSVFCERLVDFEISASPATAAPFRVRGIEGGSNERRTADVFDNVGDGDCCFQTRPGSSYTIELITPAPGYQLAGVRCTGPSQHVTGNVVFLEPAAPFTDDDVSCTFTVKEPGSIRIRQRTSSSFDEDFSYSVTGAGLSAFSLDNDGSAATGAQLPSSRLFRNLAPGNFSVTLAAKPGFRLTALTCTTTESPDIPTRKVSIHVSQGEDVDCTFEITELASVRVTLDVRPEDQRDFVFDTSSLGSPASVTLDDDGVTGPARTPDSVVLSNRLPGDYTIQQGSGGAGPVLDLRSITCTGTVLSRNLTTRSVTFRLHGGENLACTFRNDRQGSITIIEDSQPDGAIDYVFNDSELPGPFTLDDDADPTNSNTRLIAPVSSGSVHVVTQAAAPGSPPWRLVSLTCNTGESTSLAARTATIAVDPGEQVTCTFVNEQFLPDALIAPSRAGPFAGDDIRSGTVLDTQTLERTVSAPGQHVVTVVKAQNESGATDDLVVRSVESGEGAFDVAYRVGGVDVTAQVRSPAGFTFAGVGVGGERVVAVEFTARANAAAGPARKADVTVSSATAPEATDVVRAKVRRT